MNWTVETANAMVKIFTNALEEPVSEDTRKVLVLEKIKWEHRRDVKKHYQDSFLGIKIRA